MLRYTVLPFSVMLLYNNINVFAGKDAEKIYLPNAKTNARGSERKKALSNEWEKNIYLINSDIKLLNLNC